MLACCLGFLRGEPSASSSSSVLLSSLELSHIKVYELSKRALLGTAAHFCEEVVLKLRTACVVQETRTITCAKPKPPSRTSSPPSTWGSRPSPSQGSLGVHLKVNLWGFIQNSFFQVLWEPRDLICEKLPKTAPSTTVTSPTQRLCVVGRLR